MSEFVRDMPVWPGPVPATGQLFFYDTDTDQEYRILPGQLVTGAAPDPGAGLTNTVDLLKLTADQILEVLALAFTDCDADPAASPSWSMPGHQFDAIYNGKNCHFYATRGTFDPAAPAGTTGQGPAWHYFIKLG